MVVKRHVILDIYHFKCDLNRETGSSRTKKNLEFFWCLRLALQTGKFRYWGDIIGNILLFIPLGLLIPLAFPQLSKLYIVFFCGMILSVSIELIQYFARLGILELDDIFHNTCGTVSGYLMYRGIRLIRNNPEN